MVEELTGVELFLGLWCRPVPFFNGLLWNLTADSSYL